MLLLETTSPLVSQNAITSLSSPSTHGSGHRTASAITESNSSGISYIKDESRLSQVTCTSHSTFWLINLKWSECVYIYIIHGYTCLREMCIDICQMLSLILDLGDASMNTPFNINMSIENF